MVKQTLPVCRATFSLPADIPARIDALRVRASKNGALANGSEIVRAGIAALEVAEDKKLVELLQEVEKLHPGRRSRR